MLRGRDSDGLRGSGGMGGMGRMGFMGGRGAWWTSAGGPSGRGVGGAGTRG